MAVEVVAAAVGAEGGAADDEIGKHGVWFLSGFQFSLIEGRTGFHDY